jgi:hypothetical protein
MTLQYFSLTKSSPLDWKDNYLLSVGGTLVIMPKWLGKRVKQALVYFGNLTNLKLNYGCLERIRKEFAALAQQEVEKNSHCSGAKRKAKQALAVNKNVQCFNEKLMRFNVLLEDKSKTLEPIPLLPLLPLRIEQPEQTSAEKEALSKRMRVVLGSEIERKTLHIQALTKWVLAQHTSFQPTAYAAAQSVVENHIDHPTFFSALDQTLQMVQADLQGRPVGLVSWVNMSKASNLLVKMIAKRMLKPQQEFAVQEKLTEYGMNLTKPPSMQEDARDWVIVDDALYEGLEFKNRVLAKIREVLMSHIHQDGEIRIYIAIPYMTKEAYEELQKPFLNNERFKIILHPPKIMPSIETIRRGLSKEDVIAGHALIPPDQSPSIVSTTFDHCMPDERTFPSALINGVVLKRTYKSIPPELQTDASVALKYDPSITIEGRRLKTIQKLYGVTLEPC